MSGEDERVAITWWQALQTAAMVAVAGLLLYREFGPGRAVMLDRVRDVSEAEWSVVTSRGERIGSIAAPVTIVAFADFQCPACRLFAQVTLPRIFERFGDSVTVLFRHWPLSYHPAAYDAARASLCAAVQGRFQAFHDVLFAEQDSIGAKAWWSFGRQAGVPDSGRFAACNAGLEMAVLIDEDVDVARAMQAAGTPAVLVNQRRFVGTPSLQELEEEVERALAARR